MTLMQLGLIFEQIVSSQNNKFPKQAMTKIHMVVLRLKCYPNILWENIWFKLVLS